ncbi:MAG: TonB-dependent receptor [Desulfobacterales bacterium]|nr:TonB-dependent receptor [Desulfobacterales bacterium]
MRYSYFVIPIILVVGIGLWPNPFLFAGNKPTSSKEYAAKLITITGKVEYQDQETPTWKPVAINQFFFHGSKLRTSAHSRASLLMADESLIHINKDTVFEFQKIATTAGWLSFRERLASVLNQSIYRIERGEIWLRNQNQNIQMQIQSPSITASIRGTEINIKINPDDSVHYSVLQGTIHVENEVEEIVANSGEQVIAQKGHRLQKSILLSPIDAVQWTIPVPSVIHRYSEFKKNVVLQQSIDRMYQGNIVEAKKMIEKQIELYPDNSENLALYSLMLLLLSEKNSALEYAQKASNLAPQWPAAFLLLSYVYQAHFDLPNAIESIEKARRLSPDDLLVLSQYAKLLFGSDRIQEASDVSQQAMSLIPKNDHRPNFEYAEAMTVNGFLQFAQRKIDSAMVSFTFAIHMNPELGDSHLGLSLCYMRQGKIEKAIEEISIAVLLEPRRSIYLSYWAKMLYQLKRFDRALDMLDYAEKLDPKDPTPLLYRSVILRDLNRAVESIDSLNKAIQLNNNRAVYRSTYLLDQDLAVKNVNQTIIYNQLGLTDWARSKAIASIKTDYHNASGHIFLAGALLNMEGRLQGGSSENLLGLMLEPANLNSFNTFQEYTSFFEKPSINGILSATGGTDATFDENLIVYGALPESNVAFSSMVKYSKTDGWNDTNHEQHKSASLSLKWDPLPQNGLLCLLGYPYTYENDYQFNRYEYDSKESSSPKDWNKMHRPYIMLGYHHNLSKESSLLCHFKYQDTTNRYKSYSINEYPYLEDVAVVTDDQGKLKYPSVQSQIHLMHQLGQHQLLGGILVDFRDKKMSRTGFEDYYYYGIDPPAYLDTVLLNMQGKTKDHYECYYIEDMWRINSFLSTEAALYYEVFRNSNVFSQTSWHQYALNPRLGIMLKPNSHDTLRLAAFRYLVPSTVERLDPTDISGIPVFRNNYQGSLSETLEAAVEHEWNSGYAAFNVFYIDSEQNEKLSESYSHWATRLKGCEQVVNQLIPMGMGLRWAYRYMSVENTFVPKNDRDEHLASLTASYF